MALSVLEKEMKDRKGQLPAYTKERDRTGKTKAFLKVFFIFG